MFTHYGVDRFAISKFASFDLTTCCSVIAALVDKGFYSSFSVI